MASKQDEYIFKVNADITKAESSIDKITKKMENLERTIAGLHSKGINNNDSTNQKDMDKSIRSMKEMANESYGLSITIQNNIAKADKAMRKIRVPWNASDERKSFLYEQKENLQKFISQAQKALQVARQLEQSANKKHNNMTGFSQRYSKGFENNWRMNSDSYYNMPKDRAAAERRARAMLHVPTKEERLAEANNRRHAPGADTVQSRTRDLRNMLRRGDNLSQNGAAAGYMSEQQAKSFHKFYKESQTSVMDEMEKNRNDFATKGQQRSKIEERVNKMQNDEHYSTGEGRQRLNAEMEELKQVTADIKAMEELHETLVLVNQSFQDFRARLTDSNNPIETKPKRGSFRGMIYERAPAVGLAMGGTMAGVFGGLIGQGQGISRAIRPDLVYAGISSGMNGNNWQNGILGNAMGLGKSNRLGFSAQDMLSFQSSYLNNAGFTSMSDLSSAMTNQAKFSRATGIDANTTSGFFGAMANTGGVNGSQMKDLQDAFVGGIKESGMEGRQQQQLAALQSIVTNVSQDKSLSNSQVNSVVALQGLLASSGNRSMQGQSGADFLNQMNSGIKSSFWNPQMRMIFGAGTTAQGGGGLWNLEKQMNSGIVGKSGLKNLQTLTNYSMVNGGSNKGMQNYIFSALSQQMGLNLSTDQISQFMNMARSGQLTEKNVQDFEKKTKAAGKKQSAKNSKNYSSSQAATQNQSDAVTSDQALKLYDSMTKILTAFNSRLGGLNTAAYALTLAFGALALEMGISALSFGASSGIRTMTSGTFGRSVGRVEGEEVPGLFGRIKNSPRTKQAMEDAKNTRLGKVATKVANSPLGKATKSATTKATESSVGQGIAKALGKVKATGFGKSLGLLTKIGSKAMLPLSIVGGVVQTARAKKGDRIHQGISAAGGIAGGIGGAEAGAAIGSIAGPLGTIVGGLIGGIGGGIVGSGVGGWIGKKVQGAFNSHHSASSSSKSSPASKQQDTHNTTVKSQTESKRTNNIQNESYNLNSQSKQLNQMNNLLATAKMQNGIIGSMGAAGVVAGASASTGGSKSGKIVTGKTANTIESFLKGKGMSNGAISGIMGNLMQESGLNPNAVNSKSGATGIAQWLGGRKSGLSAYAKSTGGSTSSLQTQLGYLWKEMSSGKYGSVSAMNGMSASQAASYFEHNFEKAGSGAAIGSRQNYANQYATQLGKNVSSSSSKNGQVTASINVNVKGDGSSTVASELSSNSAMKNVASKLQQMVFGSMSYYSSDTTRVV